MNTHLEPLYVLHQSYSNSLDDDESIVYKPIPTINISLRRHQYAVIDRMNEYENKLINGYKINNSTLYSRYGILGDSVGVGKTFMVLGHIASIKNSRKNFEFSTFNRCSTQSLYSLEKREVQDLSNAGCLVIVPHTLFRQWSDEIKNKTSLNVALMKTKKNIQSDKFVNDIINSDLVLVSNTLYKDLYLRTEELKIKWNRVYIDEADTIELVSTYIRKEPTTNFVWLITASFSHLLFPASYSVYIGNTFYEHFKTIENVNPEMEDFMKKNFRHTTMSYYFHSYVRSFRFLSEILNGHHNLRGHCVIRCSKEFIDKSIVLPSLITKVILCKQSLSHELIYDVINNNIRQLLNAGDIISCLEQLGVKTENNNSLIDAVNESKQKELDRLIKTYEFKQSLEYSSPQIKEQALKNLEEKIRHLKEQITNFRERIENYKNDICPICYDEPSDPLITSCCSRIFCALCVLQSLSRNLSCPLCRANIRPSSLKKITSENIVIQNKKEDGVNEPKKKVETLFNIIENVKDGKYLIFSRYDNSFIEILQGMQSRNLVAKELKGSKDMIASTLKNFKDGTVNCLFLNTIQMGAGLNITDATHVILLHAMTHEEEKQILGRAYRVGRTKELQFIKLYYPNEMNNTTEN